jgi:predicted ribosome-associated RNA-binding protein Tma20
MEIVVKGREVRSVYGEDEKFQFTGNEDSLTCYLCEGNMVVIESGYHKIVVSVGVFLTIASVIDSVKSTSFLLTLHSIADAEKDEEEETADDNE